MSKENENNQNSSIFFIAMALGILWIKVAKTILLPLVMGLLLALILKPFHIFLMKKKVNSEFSALVILVFILGIIGYSIYFLSEPVMKWGRRIPFQLKRIEEMIESKSSLDSEEAGNCFFREFLNQLEKQPEEAGIVILHFFENVLVYTGLSLFITFFFLAYGEMLYRKIFLSKNIIRLSKEIEIQISRYLFTITLINICLGVVVGLAMFLNGLPNPFLWGGLAFVLNFVPYFGAMVGIVLIFIAAFLSFDNWARILLTPVLYFLLTSLEGNLITPMILGKKFKVNPLIIFLWLMLCGWLWGVAGGIIAVPVLMALKISGERVRVLKRFKNIISY